MAARLPGTAPIMATPRRDPITASGIIIGAAVGIITGIATIIRQARVADQARTGKIRLAHVVVRAAHPIAAGGIETAEHRASGIGR
jgi:hypothetical protein